MSERIQLPHPGFDDAFSFKADQINGEDTPALRPQLISDFVGQADQLDNLKVFMGAAKSRGEPLDHTLLYGPPGLGKTTLAQIIANEMGGNMKTLSAPALEKAGDLVAVLTSMNDNEVLFIDEIHRLSPQIEEILYPVMEDFYIDLIVGEGQAARSIRIDTPKFTLVGATTRAGSLSAPLRDRFGIPVQMAFYEPEDLLRIVTRSSHVLKIKIDAEAAMEVAKRSRGTPRIANRLLRRVRDYAHQQGKSSIDRDTADYALDKLKIDEHGLDHLDRKYLSYLHSLKGRPVGIETIAAYLGEARDSLEDMVEPYLLQKGFLLRTSRGRVSPEFDMAQTQGDQLGMNLSP